MNISIFHYHLNPGGVTRIIESQVSGLVQLNPAANIQIITGSCENPEFYESLGVKVKINPKLNYLEDKDYSNDFLIELFEELILWLEKQFRQNEILHLHNLNLGKNPLLTLAFNHFLIKGYAIINHAHDFAEDRPKNWTFLTNIIEKRFNKNLENILYPNSNKYTIGVLNQFDYDRVIKYGIQDSRVYLWPNPVHTGEKISKSKTDCKNELCAIFNIPDNHKIITYPVRVIQRKNIGELILLTYLYHTKCTFLVTLAPRNPVELEIYNKWLLFCKEYNIPLIFEAGLKADFETIITGSDYCITTSMKEGFGMAYLEPWTMGTPVIGRNIEYVTSDIKQKGVVFPLLYNTLEVPLNSSMVDFKELSIDKQQIIIKQVISTEISKSNLLEFNDYLNNFPPKIEESLIRANNNTIEQEFSLSKYAERIFNTYKTLY